jgi:hypothetical protein
MTTIPKISKVMQKKHAGESVAIVDGKIVAFGKDCLEAEKEAMKKGFKPEEIMTTYVMGDKYYAL